MKETCIGNYVSLSTEVRIKDIAEGFDRALRREAGLAPSQPFDAIVHSTGMLVVRAWLSTYTAAAGRRQADPPWFGRFAAAIFSPTIPCF